MVSSPRRPGDPADREDRYASGLGVSAFPLVELPDPAVPQVHLALVDHDSFAGWMVNAEHVDEYRPLHVEVWNRELQELPAIDSPRPWVDATEDEAQALIAFINERGTSWGFSLADAIVDVALRATGRTTEPLQGHVGHVLNVRRAAETVIEDADDPGYATDDDWRFVADTLRGLVAPHLVTIEAKADVEADPAPLGLDTALAIQVWNFIVDGRPLVLCANENCAHPWFQRRRTGKPATQTRASTYCSPQCENAARQRRWQRENKTKNRLDKETK